MTGDRFRLDGRVALVTGGGRGLGRGMALALAGAGAWTAVASRDERQLAETVALVHAHGGRALALPCDVAGEGAPARLAAEVVDRLGRLDVLVHAAGNQVRKPALDLSAAEFDAVLAVHLRAAFLLAQAAARSMVEQGEGGSVVLVGSMTSAWAGLPGVTPYATAKSGLLGLARTLAVEWAPHGIRVNVLAPGFFATEMTRDVADDPGRRAVYARIPMGRTGEPDDLAGAVVFLAAPASAYVTGQVLAVDGGWTVA